MGEMALSTIGQAIFVRKNLSVTDKGGFYTHHPVTNHSGIFQYIKIRTDKDEFIIGNIHGLWLPTGKLDNPERIKQSEMIIDLYATHKGKKIICGDFNLRPETESIAIFNKDFKNLIKDFVINSTRSSFYKDAERYKDFISDYVFVSMDVNVVNYKYPLATDSVTKEDLRALAVWLLSDPAPCLARGALVKAYRRRCCD